MADLRNNHPQSVQKPAELVGGPYDGCRVKLGEDYPYVLIIGRYAYAITDDLRYECMGPDSAAILNAEIFGDNRH
jgi:hypothetical protein